MLARQPQGVGRHDGHHRRPAPRHRNLRGPQAQGPGRAGRDLRHRRAALRQAARQDDHHRQERDRHGEASTTSRRTRSSRSTPATTSRPATRSSAGPIIPHDILRIKGEEAALPVPADRGAERLPQPGREDQRQAHRDHPQPDAPQGEGRRRRRHQVPARRGAWTSSASARATSTSAQSVQGRRAGRHQLQGRRRRHSRPSSRRPTRPPRPPARNRPRPRSPSPARGKTLLLGITKASPAERVVHLAPPASRRRPRC